MEFYVRPIILWNIIVFMLYGYDKYMAIKGKFRVSERILILCAFLMGAPGAVLAMECFRHKTRKNKFKAFITAACLVNLLIWRFLWIE